MLHCQSPVLRPVAFVIALIATPVLAENLPLTFPEPASSSFSGTVTDAKNQQFTVKLTGVDSHRYYGCTWSFTRGGTLPLGEYENCELGDGESDETKNVQLTWQDTTDQCPEGVPGVTEVFFYTGDPPQNGAAYLVKADVSEKENEDAAEELRTGSVQKNVYVYPFVLGVADATNTSNNVTDSTNGGEAPTLYVPEGHAIRLSLGAGVDSGELGRTKYRVSRRGDPPQVSTGDLNPTPDVNLTVTDALRVFDVYVWKDDDNGNDVDHGTEQVRQVVVVVLALEIANPTDTDADGNIDDPATVANSRTGNEFTYTTANPGQLIVPVRLRIRPDTEDVRNAFQNKVRIRITAIDDSHTSPSWGNVRLSWDNAYSGEATAGNGVYDPVDQLWHATVTFTNLPPENGDFGEKTVTVHVLDGATTTATATVDIEVFWPLLVDPAGGRSDGNYAKNHPGADLSSAANENNGVGPGERAPNWFYYWRQVVPNAEQARYAGTTIPGFGRAPAVRWFHTGYSQRHDRLLIGQIACNTDTAGGITALSGRRSL